MVGLNGLLGQTQTTIERPSLGIGSWVVHLSLLLEVVLWRLVYRVTKQPRERAERGDDPPVSAAVGLVQRPV